MDGRIVGDRWACGDHQGVFLVSGRRGVVHDKEGT
jgi:hypothetical protein